MSEAKRVVIYCRQSRDGTGEGAAVERQESACRGLCEARGWQVLRVETDNDVSASTGRVRPAWARVLASVSAGDVDVIVAWHLDRVTRTMRDLESLIDLTQAHGVGLATATGDLDLTTDSGRMVGRILAAVARGEVERKGQRQIAQNQQRVSAGRPRWAHRPFGYEKDGTLREEEAARLRWAYEQVMAGTRLATICKAWNASGVTTTTGSAWTTQSLGKLLRDPRNAGLIRYQGQEAGRGQWPSILGEDAFRVAVARMGQPGRRRGGAPAHSDAWLVTVAACGECGGRVFTSRHPGGARAYACQKGHLGLPVGWTDGRVLLSLMDFLGDDAYRDRWERLAAERADQGAELRQRHALSVERMDNLAADYADALISREQMLKGTQRLRESVAAIEAELSKLGIEGDRLVFDAEWFASALTALPLDQVRELLRSVTDRIVLHRRGKGRKGLWPELVEVVPRGGGP